MNWAAFAIAVAAAAATIVVLAARRSPGTRTGMLLAVPLLIVLCLNGAAPVRGAIDPGYMGYVFGMLSADMGLAVTFIAGPIVVACFVSALIAATRRRGKQMWIVSATCAALAIILGLPLARTALDDPSANMIQLGEYLTIPGLAATFILLGLLVLPFGYGSLWSARAARA